MHGSQLGCTCTVPLGVEERSPSSGHEFPSLISLSFDCGYIGQRTFWDTWATAVGTASAYVYSALLYFLTQ
jgi:hypothetical protein